MKKIFRFLVIGVIVAIVFLVASVAIFVAVFDANAYKQDLSDLVRAETGRDLQFHGDVELTIYPALGMKLGALSLSNAEGFGAKPMIKVRQVSVSVDMTSLITLTPQIGRLVMRDLEVSLITNRAGVTNWDDLLQPAPPESGAATSAAPSAQTEAASGFQIEAAFAGLDLENIKLLWLDEQAGIRFEITDLDIATGRIEPDRPFPLRLHLDASAGDGLDIVFDFESQVEFLIEQQQLSFNEMLVSLNEFAIGGRLQLSDFSRSTPRLRFDLASQALDIDALLGTPPPAHATDDAETPPPAGAAAEQDVKIELPVKILRELDIDGNLDIAQLKVQNLRMQELAVAIKAQNGLIGLKPLTLNMYGGRVESAIVIDVKYSTPSYAIDETLQGLQIGDLLKDFSGEERISGRLDAAFDLTTRGEWLSELKKNANGSLQLAFLDGALNGFNMRYAIDSAKAKLRGKQPPSEEALKTDFSSLTLSGVISRGVFTSDDFDLQAPLMRAGGKGSADFNRETVDFLVDAKLVGSVEGQRGEAADDLAGLDIPVQIEGAFADPRIDVLLDEMLQQRAAAEKDRLKAEIRQEKEKIQQQLEAEKQSLEAAKKLEKRKDKAKNKLEDKLNKLFD